MGFDELKKKYPTMPEELLMSLNYRGSAKGLKPETYLKRLIKKKEKEISKSMKRVSKHLNTEQFNEYFQEFITPQATAAALREIIVAEDEKTENKLKAIQEVHKYTMIPSQAQEIRHEIDDTWGDDKEDRLKELMEKANENK